MSFLLQAFNEPAFIKNFQMHLLVDNVDDGHSHVLADQQRKAFGVQVGDPKDKPWAMRDFTLFDPSGVVWRIAQNLPDKAKLVDEWSRKQRKRVANDQAQRW